MNSYLFMYSFSPQIGSECLQSAKHGIAAGKARSLALKVLSLVKEMDVHMRMLSRP